MFKTKNKQKKQELNELYEIIENLEDERSHLKQKCIDLFHTHINEANHINAEYAELLNKQEQIINNYLDVLLERINFLKKRMINI